MFKVGDYVVRVEDGSNIFREQGGVLGAPYKVTYINPEEDELKVEGINYTFTASRFKLQWSEPERNLCDDGCQFAKDVGMPEHSCAGKCQYDDHPDVVKSPSHYQFFPGVEAIEIIAASMSEEGFHGYCMGNRLKYRLRAGNKDKLEQDISKSDFYVELFNKHKHLCKAAK